MKKRLLILAGLALPLVSWAEDAKTLPYASSLYSDTEWTTVDANGDNFTWKDDATNNAIKYSYNYDASTGGDDWYISPAIHLEAGKIYTMAFSYKTQSSFLERLKLQLASEGTVEALAAGETLFTTGTYGVATYDAWLDENSTFTVEADGDYYFGFHCFSASDRTYLYVCDFEVAEYVTTPTAPTDLTATAGDDQTVTLQWTLPTTDTTGAALTDALTAVEVYRDSKLVATLAGDATTYTDSDLDAGLHTYTVVAVLGSAKSEEAASATAVVKAGPATLPWSSDLSSQVLFDNMWTTARGASSTMGSYAGWVFEANEYLGNRAKMYGSSNMQEDEWLISPALNFDKAGTYTIAIEAMVGYGNNSNLKLYLGNGTEISAFTQQIAELNNELTYTKTEYKYTFNVAAPGVYYIAAQANCNRGGWKASETTYIYSMSVESFATVPAQVSDLAVVTNGDQIDLSWTNPSKDNTGGDLESLSRVEIYRDDVLMQTLTEVTPGEASTWSDTNPNYGVNTYWVIAYNENGAAEGEPVKVQSEKYEEGGESIPYTANFYNWTRTTDDNTVNWVVYDYASTGDRAYFNTGSDAPNAWIISEQIKLEPNYVYDVEFYAYTSLMSDDFELTFTSGSNTNSSSQSTLATVNVTAQRSTTPQYVWFVLRADADGKGTDGITDDDADGIVSVPAGNRTFGFHGDKGGTVNVRQFTITENEVASVRNMQRAQGGYAIYGDKLHLDAAANVAIVDLSGKTVLTASATDTVDLSQLGKGVYIFRADADGHRVVGKFVK